jgi:hypothetical protein
MVTVKRKRAIDDVEDIQRSPKVLGSTHESDISDELAIAASTHEKPASRRTRRLGLAT